MQLKLFSFSLVYLRVLYSPALPDTKVRHIGEAKRLAPRHRLSFDPKKGRGANIVQHKGRTSIFSREAHLDIVKSNALRMSHIKSVGGNSAEHTRFWITFFILGNDAGGVLFCSAAFVMNPNIAQPNVLDHAFRKPRYYRSIV